MSEFEARGCRLRFGGNVDLGHGVVIMFGAIVAVVSLFQRQGGQGEKRALPGRPNGQRGAQARVGRGPWACGRGVGLCHRTNTVGEQIGKLVAMIVIGVMDGSIFGVIMAPVGRRW